MKSRARHFFERLARIRENRAIFDLSVLSAIFVGLALYIHSPGLLQTDLRITRAIQWLANGPLNHILAGVTMLGGMGTLIILEILVAFGLYRTKRPRAAALCLATLLWLPLNTVIKDVIARPRPDPGIVDVVLPTIGLSFPSGHAMGSTVVYGFLALMAWIHIPRRRARIGWTTTFIVIAFLVSLSRVYLGAHWFSDVVGGWAAGLIFLLLLAEFYKLLGTAELAPRDAEVAEMEHGKGPPGGVSRTA